VPLQEFELRVNTKTIVDLKKYLLGITLNIDSVFDEFIVYRWGRNYKNSKPIFDTELSQAIAGVRTLMSAYREGIPISKPSGQLNNEEIAFLLDMEKCVLRGMDEEEIISELGDQYHISDMWKNRVNSDTVRRRKIRKLAGESINKLMTCNKKDINFMAVARVISTALSQMGFGANTLSIIMHALSNANFFTLYCEPINVSVVLAEAVDSLDVDELLKCISRTGEIITNRKNWLEKYETVDNHWSHDGRHTMAYFG
jgi:hypothetical protein